jgi:hypothetical protein
MTSWPRWTCATYVSSAATGGWHAVNQAIHAPDRLASLCLLDPTTVSAKFSAAVYWRGAAAAILNHERSWRRFLHW